MPDHPPIDSSVHARQEWSSWLMFAVSLVFFGMTLAVAPDANCSGSECYPTLVWIGRAVGAVFASGFGMLLITNPSRGVRLDPETGELFWWAASRGRQLLHTGRIHPSRIARIEIDETEDDIMIRLIGQDGRPVPGFSHRVLPMDGREWAARAVARWPHIALRDNS